MDTCGYYIVWSWIPNMNNVQHIFPSLEEAKRLVDSRPSIFCIVILCFNSIKESPCPFFWVNHKIFEAKSKHFWINYLHFHITLKANHKFEDNHNFFLSTTKSFKPTKLQLVTSSRPTTTTSCHNHKPRNFTLNYKNLKGNHKTGL